MSSDDYEYVALVISIIDINDHRKGVSDTCG